MLKLMYNELIYLIKNKLIFVLFAFLLCYFSSLYFYYGNLNNEKINEFKDSIEVTFQEVQTIKLNQRSSNYLSNSDNLYIESFNDVLFDLKIDNESLESNKMSWQERLLLENFYMTLILQDSSFNFNGNYSDFDYLNQIEINNIFLENNIRPYETEYEMNMLNYLFLSINTITIIILLIINIIIVSTLILDDFEYNTYKIVYTNTYSKSKILLSKIMASLIYTILLFLISLFICSLLIFIIDGFGEVNYFYSINSYLLNFKDTIIYLNSLEAIIVKLSYLLSIIIFSSSLFSFISIKIRDVNYYYSIVVMIITLCFVMNNLIELEYLTFIPILAFNIDENLIQANINIFVLLAISFVFSIVINYFSKITINES